MNNELQKNKTYFHRYLTTWIVSFLALVFIGPFFAILIPTEFSIFAPFICQLAVFFILSHSYNLETCSLNTKKLKLFFIPLITFTVLLIIDGFIFSQYTVLSFSPYILAFIILIPVQTLSEELIFRHCPLIIANQTRSKTLKLATVITFSVFFALMHFNNPEAVNKIVLLYYFLWGLCSILLTLYTDGIEVSFALHLANNLFIAVIMNYPDSAIQTYSLFIRKTAPNIGHLVTFATLAFFIITIETIFIKRIDYGKTEKN